MSGALSLLDRQHVGMFFEDGAKFALSAAFSKDSSYTLFRYEDWPAWATFTSVFLVLIVFDNVILHRNPSALTVTSAVVYTLFWIAMAGCFCAWVCWWYSPSAGFMWLSGYMLEWMLSFDNLFVFHLIFCVFGTPDQLKHRPLYLGIMGAVVFRLVFIFVGEYLMHAMSAMHFVFGAFLIYTGIKTVTTEEEDEDPSQQPMVSWLKQVVPFVCLYDSKGAFFVKVPVDERGREMIPESAIIIPEAEPTESDPLVEQGDDKHRVGVVDFARFSDSPRLQTRATMLFLVVCCLEVSDLLFAVDSVSAIVAQVNDLFLAYTSAVFAMLGLRATFFIIDVLVQLFSLLKYGVAVVLMFIGFKLIVGKFYHVPASVVCVVLVGAIAGSMVASVIQEKLQKKQEGKLSPEIAERVARVKNSPFASPMPVHKGV